MILCLRLLCEFSEQKFNRRCQELSVTKKKLLVLVMSVNAKIKRDEKRSNIQNSRRKSFEKNSNAKLSGA